jgi:Uma2 family endonuclease
MNERLEEQVGICDDFSPFFEEESMPESIVHAELIWYLVAVLRWLFRGELCAICENFAFFPPLEQLGQPVAPDLAVIKGVALRPLSSWRIGTTGPAPHVVLEILSPETWKKDLEEKPDLYARLGVHEYFAYDPTPAPLAPTTQQRLFGWRRDPLLPRMRALVPNEDGSLWSEELASFLLADGQLLRLADADHHLRLTEAEARAQQVEIEAAARRTEARARWEEAAARQAAERRAQAQAQQVEAEAAARRAEAAARQAAERRAQALAEKLRSLGVDPDQP